MIIGAIILTINPGPLFTREGYSEIFYPPSLAFISLSIGVILMVFYIVDKNSSFDVYKPFQLLGESSLFIYITHIAIINLVMVNIFEPMNGIEFTLLQFALVLVMMGIAYGLRIFRSKNYKLPYLLRFFIGA